MVFCGMVTELTVGDKLVPFNLISSVVPTELVLGLLSFKVKFINSDDVIELIGIVIALTVVEIVCVPPNEKFNT